LPSRAIFHGVEGIGKTSFAAFAPSPICLMTRGETGLLTLIDNGRIPATDHFDECETWGQVTSAIRYLIENQTPNRTLVFDTLNGAERLCFEYVCQDRYNGDWVSFDAYGRGPNVALAEWNDFLTNLDRLRFTRRMAIIVLCHTKVKTYNNPLGENFDRYTPDMNDKTWGLAAKWADIVLFGNFEILVKKTDKASKAKATGGERRILYTTRSAAFDAKNRMGLPAQIPMGNSAESAWKAFADALARSRRTLSTEQRPVPATSNESTTSSAPATGEQLARMSALSRQLQWEESEFAALVANYGKERPEELTREQAGEVLTEMEDQVRRQAEEQGGD